MSELEDFTKYLFLKYQADTITEETYLLITVHVYKYMKHLQSSDTNCEG